MVQVRLPCADDVEGLATLMSARQSWPSLHQLLQAESGPANDSAVSCSDLNDVQQGLGQAWLDAIAPQEDDKLSRRFAWSGLDAGTLRRVLARASEPEEAAVSEPWWDELKAWALATATGSLQRPRRMINASLPSIRTLTWSVPLLLRREGGFLKLCRRC